MARRGTKVDLTKSEGLVLHRHGFKIEVPAKALRHGILPIKLDAVLNNVDTIQVETANTLNNVFGINITKEAM